MNLSSLPVRKLTQTGGKINEDEKVDFNSSFFVFDESNSL